MTTTAERLGGPALDDLDRAGRRRRTVAWVGALCAALVSTVVLGVGLGPVAVAPDTVAQIIGHHVLGVPAAPTWALADDNIIWLVRLPRVLLGAVVGAALAATGVAIQALVRNVLADPFLLGTSSGASTGAAAAILFGIGASLGAAAVSVSAFAGALAATALTFATARIGGRVTSIRLVLAGISVAYVLSALTSFLIAVLAGLPLRCHPSRQRLVTKLAPFLGITLDHGAVAHEQLRTLLEACARDRGDAYRDLAYELGYQVRIPREVHPSWWLHLVLVYFKRVHLNRPSRQLCAKRPACHQVFRCGCTPHDFSF